LGLHIGDEVGRDVPAVEAHAYRNVKIYINSKMN
jgi:hypothetical protein